MCTYAHSTSLCECVASFHTLLCFLLRLNRFLPEVLGWRKIFGACPKTRERWWNIGQSATVDVFFFLNQWPICSNSCQRTGPNHLTASVLCSFLHCVRPTSQSCAVCTHAQVYFVRVCFKENVVYLRLYSIWHSIPVACAHSALRTCTVATKTCSLSEFHVFLNRLRMSSCGPRQCEASARVATSTLEVTSNTQPLIPGLAAAACLDTTARWWTDPFPVNSFGGLETPGRRGALGPHDSNKEKRPRVCVCARGRPRRFAAACKCLGLFSAAAEGHKWFIMRLCSLDCGVCACARYTTVWVLFFFRLPLLRCGILCNDLPNWPWAF